MSNQLAESISVLRTASKDLNQAADNLNESVAMLEQVLGKELSIGLNASVVLKRTPKGSVVESLVYKKVNDKFRIAFYRKTSGMLVPETIPWSNLPRELKVSTAAKIPDLISDIFRKVSSELASMNSATDAINQVLTPLINKEEK